jgi:hypothetical protein
MRRDLVEAAINAASLVLFEDVLYTHAPDAAVVIQRAIAGVEKVSERFEVFGQALAECSHMTRALKAKFPSLSKNDLIFDGVSSYRVIAWETIGDGRFEIAIGLKPV